MCDFKSKSHRFIFYGSFVYHVLDVMTFVLHRSRPRLYGNSFEYTTPFSGIELITLVPMGTDYIFNYHTTTVTIHHNIKMTVDPT
jgi:hypothetical protein